MLRDLNISVQGRRDSTSPQVGVKSSQIPSGFENESFLLNDVDAGFPNRLYSLEILALPSAGTLYLDKAGVGSFADAPAGTYTGTQRVNKYDEGTGLVSSTTGTFTLEVRTPVLPLKVTGVTISPTVAFGSQQFTATVLGENNPSQEVTWSKIGVGSLDSATGYFTEPPAASEIQTAEIKATSKADPTYSAVATVAIPAAVVVPVPIVRGIVITPLSVVLGGGEQTQVSAFVYGDNDPSQEVSWASDLGTIDQEGIVTAPSATMARQKGKIMATSTQNPEISAEINFDVLAATASDFVPSTSRTIRVLPGRTAFAVGSHWTLGSVGPVGPKDPNSTIDIPFDWSAWLADIGAAQLSKIEFFLSGGLQQEGAVAGVAGGTIIVSGGVSGYTATVTCRITTATTPPRTDDRTAVLQIKDQ